MANEKEKLIKKLERTVIAYNTPLRDAVKDMDVILLLRNCHPLWRSDLAYECRDAGLLTTEEINEFIKRN